MLALAHTARRDSANLLKLSGVGDLDLFRECSASASELLDSGHEFHALFLYLFKSKGKGKRRRRVIFLPYSSRFHRIINPVVAVATSNTQLPERVPEHKFKDRRSSEQEQDLNDYTVGCRVHPKTLENKGGREGNNIDVYLLGLWGIKTWTHSSPGVSLVFIFFSPV